MAEDYIMNTKIKVDTKEATSQLTVLKNKIVISSDKITELQKKMEALGKETVSTEAFAKLEADLRGAEEELSKLVEKEKELSDLGAEGTDPWNRVIEEESLVADKIDEIKAKMEALKSTGKDVTLKDNSVEIEKARRELEKEQGVLEGLKQKYDEVADKSAKSLDKLKGKFSSFGKAILKLLGFATLIRAIRRMFTQIIGLTKQGIDNLVQKSKGLNAVLSEFKSNMATLKNSLASAFEPIITTIVPYINVLLNKLVEASNKMAQFFAGLAGRSTFEKAKKQVIDYAQTVEKANNRLAGFDDLNVLENDSTGGEKTGADAFETVEIDENVLTFADKVKEKWEQVKETFAPFIEFFQKLVNKIKELLSPLWEDLVKPILEGIPEGVRKVFEVIGKVLSDVANNEVAVSILGAIAGGIMAIAIAVGVWNVAQAILNGLLSISPFGLVVIAITAIITAVILLITYWDEIKKKTSEVWQAIKETVSKWITQIKDKISTAMGNIKGTFKRVWEYVEDKTKSVFKGIWDFIKKIINGILGGIEGMCNGVISGINAVIGAINKLSFTIPDWVGGDLGGSTFGFDIKPLSKVSIPRLATGGITTGATLAQIGEAGREAVLPLEQNTEWLDMLADRLNQQSNVNIRFEGSLSALAKVLKPALDTESTRIGRNLTVSY